MFEARVAQFYRSKGYEVHENPKVRGTSENIYTVAMVADGPLGALLISFGDAGGIDGPEIGRVRTMARDVGATPVVASPALSPDLRRLAAQMGVVVVDDSMVTETGPLPTELGTIDAARDPLRRDMDAHPWPLSGRAFSYTGPGGAEAREVEDLIADLHSPVRARTPPPPLVPPPAPAPAPPGLTAQAAAAGWQTLAAPEMLPPAPTSAPNPAVQATKFSWLGNGAAQSLTPLATGPVDLSSLLGAKPVAETPAVEHETALTAKTPTLERVQLMAGTGFDTVRDWPWKTILWTGAGAGLLVLFIRWLA